MECEFDHFSEDRSCHGMSRRIQAFCVITASVLGVVLKQTLYIYDTWGATIKEDVMLQASESSKVLTEY